MNQENPDKEQALEISPVLKLAHPLISTIFCFSIGILLIIGNFWAAGLFETRSKLISLHIPGITPLVHIVFGLITGLVSVSWEKHFLKNNIEKEARKIAFKHKPDIMSEQMRRNFLRFLPYFIFFLIATGAPPLLSYYLNGVLSDMDTLAPYLILGIMLVLYILTHPERSRIYCRAKELIAEASSEDYQYPPPHSPRISIWLNIIAGLFITSVLICGVWLHYLGPNPTWQPRLLTVVQEPGGIATQLTYSGNAHQPSPSPESAHLAWIQFAFPRDYLIVSNREFKGYRQFTKPLLPLSFKPLRWSPDGRRFLVIALPAKGISLEDAPQHDLWGDLWVVDIGTKKVTRLTQNDLIFDARWLPNSDNFVVLKLAERAFASLCLLNSKGDLIKEFTDVKIIQHPFYDAIIPWQEGNAVLALGIEDTSGLWSIDIKTGNTKLLIDLDLSFALPLDKNRIAIAVSQQNEEADNYTTKIGIFESATKEIDWIIEDFKNAVFFPVLRPSPETIFFCSNIYNANDDSQIMDIWKIDIASRSLHKITEGREVMERFSYESLTNSLIFSSVEYKIDESPEHYIDTNIWRLQLHD